MRSGVNVTLLNSVAPKIIAETLAQRVCTYVSGICAAQIQADLGGIFLVEFSGAYSHKKKWVDNVRGKNPRS